MTIFLKQIIKLIFFGNFFIALCAVAQVLLTYKLFQIKPNIFVQSLLFFATISVYNLSLVFNKTSELEYAITQKSKWAFEHHHLNVAITILSTLSLIPILFMIGFKVKMLVFLLALICFSYSFPIFQLDGKKFSLRQIGGLKIFLIALVWSVSVVYLPILEANEIVGKNLFLRWIQQFLFTIAITIPFDIKDLKEDTSLNIKTLPKIFGKNKAYNLSYILLGLVLLIALIADDFKFSINLLCLSLTLMTTMYLIYKSKNAKNELYYYIFLDGTLMLHLIFLAIFTNGNY